MRRNEEYFTPGAGGIDDDALVCDRFATHRKQYITKYRYLEVLEQAMYARGDILVDRKLNKSFWVRVRGKRLYLFYLSHNRIAIEAGIVTDEADNGLRERFKMQFVIRDNVNNGEWDLDKLSEEWGDFNLADLGLDIELEEPKKRFRKILLLN